MAAQRELSHESGSGDMPEGCRVLLVKDADSIGQVVVDVLTLEGYEVRRVRNGREALDVLRDWLPSLILLDGAAADVPIVVLSGTREARARARDLGAVEALTKPFDLNQVFAAVERWTEPGRSAAR
jgi:CheY-like chemotaxis protein